MESVGVSCGCSAMMTETCIKSMQQTVLAMYLSCAHSYNPQLEHSNCLSPGGVIGEPIQAEQLKVSSCALQHSHKSNALPCDPSGPICRAPGLLTPASWSCQEWRRAAPMSISPPQHLLPRHKCKASTQARGRSRGSNLPALSSQSLANSSSRACGPPRLTLCTTWCPPSCPLTAWCRSSSCSGQPPYPSRAKLRTTLHRRIRSSAPLGSLMPQGPACPHTTAPRPHTPPGQQHPTCGPQRHANTRHSHHPIRSATPYHPFQELAALPCQSPGPSPRCHTAPPSPPLKKPMMHEPPQACAHPSRTWPIPFPSPPRPPPLAPRPVRQLTARHHPAQPTRGSRCRAHSRPITPWMSILGRITCPAQACRPLGRNQVRTLAKEAPFAAARLARLALQRLKHMSTTAHQVSGLVL